MAIDLLATPSGGSYPRLGGGGGSSVLGTIGKVITAPQRAVDRVIGPVALEIGQGFDQLIAPISGDARKNIATRKAEGITGFSLGEMLNYGKNAKGERVRLFDDPGLRSGILDNALKFAWETVTDPTNYVGVGLARTAGKGASKLTASQLAKQVVSSTAEHPDEAVRLGGQIAGQVLLDKGASKGLRSALKEIDKIDNAVTALAESGFTTRRGLTFGVGDSGIIIPGTERVAAAIDKANGAVRAYGLSKVTDLLDAKDMNLGMRSRRLRQVARAADITDPESMAKFGREVDYDFVRFEVMGRKGTERTRIIKEAQANTGMSDEMVENQLVTLRPRLRQRLQERTGLTLRSFKGADADFVASSVQGRLRAVYDGTGGDRSTPLGAVINEALDLTGRKLKERGITHMVYQDAKGDFGLVEWDDVIMDVEKNARRLAEEARRKTLVAGSTTADDIVWRLIDRASADIAAHEATGLLPTVVEKKGKISFTKIMSDPMVRMKTTGIRRTGLGVAEEVADPLGLEDQLRTLENLYETWKDNPLAEQVQEHLANPAKFARKDPQTAAVLTKFGQENPGFLEQIRSIADDPKSFGARLQALRGQVDEIRGAAPVEDTVSSLFRSRAAVDPNQGTLFADDFGNPVRAINPQKVTKISTELSDDQGRLASLLSAVDTSTGRTVSLADWAHMTNAVAVDVTDIIKTSEALDAVWKTLAVARPGFSNRNYWGGIANNLAFGVSVRYHRDAPKWILDYWKDPEAFVAKSPRNARIAEVIRDLGGEKGSVRIADRGITFSDLEHGGNPFEISRVKRFGQAAQKGFETGFEIPGSGRVAKAAKIVNLPAAPRGVVAGRKSIGIPVELQLRLAAVVKFMDDGLTPEAARAMMESIHIDYADLSRIDKTAKKIYPFWTFRTRNLGIQGNVLLKGRGYSRGMLGAMMTARMEHEGEPFPPFLQGIQVPLGGGVVGSSSALPMADFISRGQDVYTGLVKGNFSDPLRAILVNEATPQINAPLEIIMGKDTFSGAPRPKTRGASIDSALQVIPFMDLLPSPFGSANRTSSFAKRTSLSKDPYARFAENFARLFGLSSADVRDYSDTSR